MQTIRLTAVAVGSVIPASEVLRVLEPAMRSLGFEAPGENWRGDGRVELWLYGRIDGGSWLLLTPRERPLPELAGAVARALNETVDVAELTGVDEVVHAQDGEEGYRFETRTFRLGPNGERVDVPFGDTEDEGGTVAARGDFHETAYSLALDLLDGALPPTGRSEVIEYVSIARAELNDRLRGILAALAEARSVTLERLQDGLFLRLQLATSSRLARVSLADLEALRSAGAKAPMP